MVNRILVAALYLSFCVLALALSASLASGDDRSDRERKVKVALALSGQPNAAAVAFGPAVAPAPRAVAPKDYAAAQKKALDDERPLVVFVSCPSFAVEGADVCHAVAGTFGDVRGPAVVVCVPVANRLRISDTLPSDAKPPAVKRAVDDAVRKIDTPPAKKMPPAPAPLDTHISATLADKASAGPLTYQQVFARVQAGESLTLAVGVKDAADGFVEELPGIKAGVYDCFLRNGVPSMALRCVGDKCPRR